MRRMHKLFSRLTVSVLLVGSLTVPTTAEPAAPVADALERAAGNRDQVEQALQQVARISGRAWSS